MVHESYRLFMIPYDILIHLHDMELRGEYIIQHFCYTGEKKVIHVWLKNDLFNEGHATLFPTTKLFKKESACCEAAFRSPQVVEKII